MLERARRGFSLLEIMIVVAIMGLLAAVAIPQFTSTRVDSRAAVMSSQLAMLRAAIVSHWTEHAAFPGPDAAALTDQFLQHTHQAGQVGNSSDGGYVTYQRLGELPSNPFTRTNNVLVVDRMPARPTGTQAWIYCPGTGEIRGNTPGTSPDGEPLFNL